MAGWMIASREGRSRSKIVRMRGNNYRSKSQAVADKLQEMQFIIVRIG